jgi:hypothetical protein
VFVTVPDPGANGLTEQPSVRSGAPYAPIRRWSAIALECLIATYSLALVVVAVTGGVDLVVVSLQRVEKPLFILLLLVPLRIGVGPPSWLLEQGRRRLPDTWAPSRLRLPPAVVDVAFALAVTRAATFFIGFVANVLLAPDDGRPFDVPSRLTRLAETFAAFDSGWYLDIASRGYYFRTDGESSIAFFPLYPMLMRAVAWPFGGTYAAVWAAGIGLSCVAFALALLALHRLTHRVSGDREAARRTVLYVAVFPFSLFFTSIYTESVFLLTSVLAVSRAYDGRWWMAGVWGALVTLTRPNGILIGLPLALLAMRGRPAPGELAARFTPLLALPLALSAYCAYVFTLSGDPLGWLSAQQHWGYSLGGAPWRPLQNLVGQLVEHGPYGYFLLTDIRPYHFFHGVTALVFLGLTPAVFRNLGAALGAYVLVGLLVPLSSGDLSGIGRYAAVLFPAFMVMGSVKSPRLHEAILISSALFLVLFVILFVAQHPIY